MRYTFSKPFAKELKNLPKSVIEDFNEVLKELEKTSFFKELSGCKLLKSNKKDTRECYRIRIGNYRAGFVLENDGLISFQVIGHRRDIYNRFP